jgi:hypothetical protein
MLEKKEYDLESSIPDKKIFSELKNLHHPPADVIDVIVALGVVMGVEPELVRNSEGVVEEHYFENTRRRFGEAHFLRELQELDVDNLPQSTLGKLDFFLDRPNFNPEGIAKINMSAACICRWIRLIVDYLEMRADILAEFP